MRWTGWVIIGVLFIFFAGCSKKEPPSSSARPHPVSPPQALPSQTPPIAGNAPVVMLDAIKDKWTAVKLLVEDKKTNDATEYTVSLGSELAIPDSSLVVRVNQFLPDLKIEGNAFTSASAELLNPSVHVQVLDNGKEIFNGWLFQLFPTVHPFQHERFSITLRDSVAAS